jgi:hypothetical protein
MLSVILEKHVFPYHKMFDRNEPDAHAHAHAAYNRLTVITLSWSLNLRS